MIFAWTQLTLTKKKLRMSRGTIPVLRLYRSSQADEMYPLLTQDTLANQCRSPKSASTDTTAALESTDPSLAEPSLAEPSLVDPSLVDLAPYPFWGAKCLPSWPPSPEIRAARAKFH